MRKLEHSHHDVQEKASETAVSRRSFLKSTAVAMGLIAGIQLGFTPSVAMAQDDTREIAGRTLRIVRVDRSLGELDRDTEQYRDATHEHLPNSNNNYVYSNDIVVPNRVQFLVSLDDRNNTRSLRVRYNYNGSIHYAEPIDLNDFATYVRNASGGAQMTRVKFILQNGTFQVNGSDTPYTNAFVFPLDANGNLITRRGNGEYIVYGAVQYANTVESNIYLLKEPNNRDTLALR